MQKEIFQGREGFVELEHFDKHFVKSKKKETAVKTFGVFSPRYSENYFLNGKFKAKTDTARVFLFQNQGTFFDFENTLFNFQKRVRKIKCYHECFQEFCSQKKQLLFLKICYLQSYLPRYI